jgi:hypothetical protein
MSKEMQDLKTLDRTESHIEMESLKEYLWKYKISPSSPISSSTGLDFLGR